MHISNDATPCQGQRVDPQQRCDDVLRTLKESWDAHPMTIPCDHKQKHTHTNRLGTLLPRNLIPDQNLRTYCSPCNCCESRTLLATGCQLQLTEQTKHSRFERLPKKTTNTCKTIVVVVLVEARNLSKTMFEDLEMIQI